VHTQTECPALNIGGGLVIEFPNNGFGGGALIKIPENLFFAGGFFSGMKNQEEKGGCDEQSKRGVQLLLAEGKKRRKVKLPGLLKL